MNRRYVLGAVAAALIALLGVRGKARVNASKTACSCCGSACDCGKCTCDVTGTAGTVNSGKDCDCCGGHTCCASSATEKAAAFIH